MAAEDYIEIGAAPGDWEDGATNCRYCGAPCFWEALPRQKWRLRDYYTGEAHTCQFHAAVEFPVDEAQ